jgi:hypothetical protein
MPDLKRIDWSNRATWPYGGAAHTFVGEALEIVGRHFYATEWTGDEFWRGYLEIEYRAVEGLLADAGKFGRLSAVNILRKFQPDIAPASEELLTDEMWTAAQAQLPRYVEARRAAAVRLRKAKEKLRDLCAKGELVGAYRWSSGDHSKIDAARWNTEKYLEWLKNGYVYFSDVRRSSFGGSESEGFYLFIESEGLEALKVTTADAISTPSEPGHLSPYLRLMIAVSHELNVSPIHQPKKVDVEAKIREISKRPGMPYMGKTAVEYAATFIREVESQAGAAAPSRQPAK